MKGFVVSQQERSRIEEFISLAWYEAFLRFIANFIAKSSEILLTAGLVVSSANFLSDGSMLKDGTPLAIAWAWTQAIAIDGSLGVSFYSVFQSLKQRDWIKFILYSILTMLLTLVAWSITEGDIFSHAVNASSHEAMQLIGIDVRLLSTLRAIAVVGFVLMSRLRDVTLWEQVNKNSEPQTIANSAELAPKEQQKPLQEERTMPFSEADLEKLIHLVLQKHSYNVTVITEEEISNVPALHPPAPPVIPERASNIDIQKEESTDKRGDEAKVELSSQEDDNTLIAQEDRLKQAYQELKEEGIRISGRALAQRAHVRRSTCLEWLRTYEQELQEQSRLHPLEQNTEPLIQIEKIADTVVTVE
jgi:hypothetical protein